MIEGPVTVRNKIILVDDVATTGGSLMKTAGIFREHGYTIKEAIVLFDREEGAREAVDFPFYSVLTRKDLDFDKHEQSPLR